MSFTLQPFGLTLMEFCCMKALNQWSRWRFVFYKKGWEMGKCIFVMCVCNSYVADQEKHFLFLLWENGRMKGKTSLLLPFLAFYNKARISWLWTSKSTRDHLSQSISPNDINYYYSITKYIHGTCIDKIILSKKIAHHLKMYWNSSYKKEIDEI